mgnify:CR=1 FL=1
MNVLAKRKNTRLKDYDYSQPGYYFVTICTKDRQRLFWKVGATCGRPHLKPQLTSIGYTVDKEINKISSIFNNIKINKYVIMPNHIHMIIVISEESGRSKTAPTISRIIQQFKGSITRQVGFPIWQKLFYDHIIRNQKEYQKVWEYIDTNPLKWEEDEYYM